MAEPLKKDLREVKLPNPFSVLFTSVRPRYRPGTTIASLPVGADCLIFRYLPRESFETPTQCHEYARDVLVQIMRDWMQPRLNYWARQMADHAVKLPMGIVEYTEIAMNTLWNVHLVLDELLHIFLTREEQESMRGRAFRMELRARLLPYVTIKPLYRIITTTLEVAYAIMKDVIDANAGRRGNRDPSFSSYRDEDDAVYSTKEAMEGLSLSAEDDQKKAARRLAEEIVLLKRIRRLYADLNRGSSLLWGLSHAPAFAVARKRAACIVDEAVADVTEPDMYNIMQQNLRDLKQFLSWFATNWPWTKSDVVTEINARYDLELDEEEARRPDRKRVDLLIDIDELVEKMTIDRLAGKIYQITIEDYPRTRPTLDLLRFCLDRHNHYGRDRLVATLIRDVSAKLLHVGKPTFQILHAYASAVESLRLLDSSCVIMHRVCKVIKDYIKKRPDTVRQIITYITTEKRHDINFSKQKHSTIVVDEDDVLGFNDEFLPGGGSVLDGDDDPRWQKWMPDPPDAQPGESCRFRKSADVFNMLVSVYGSKEMFVKEYRQLLAERLSNHLTRDPEWERKYLNLLHLRFSDGELQQCEVMLRDVEQSCKLEESSRTRQCAPLIRGHVISSHFWPNVEQEKGVEKLPPGIEEELEAYDAEFRRARPNRRLSWMRASGVTELSLTIDDVKIEKTVPNVMAAVLYAYLEKEEWDVNEMAEHLSDETTGNKVTKQLAKRRMEWWEAQGFLTQYLPPGATSECFRLTKNPANMHRFKSNMDGDEDESDEEEAEDPMDAIESLEQFWKYTKTFIANQENGEVKAERMHNIYRMFQSPSSQPISLDTVVAFLTRKVKLGLLTTNNGMYKVVKEADGKKG
ncbi:hypothetical protein PMAYCL1PPCAC_14750 [Pristionchus mayeri]|uniref:Anaphase-promoting complex subunit 2 n=1 Tax=Pristionchus mayeri TaxID=1317129 RepID=A0AAN5CHL3_9BILA|nr:hypothetical protein PMAYCL1PPCAC_14750 [Pristionchus mayeri]